MTAIRPKIDDYCDKFIDSNFDRKDRRCEPQKKFEWFVSSMHCWYYSSQSYNSNPRIAKDISLGTAQGGDAFFIIVNNKIFNINNSIDDINDSLKQGVNNTISFHLIQTKKSSSAKIGDFKTLVEIPLKIFKNKGIDETQPELLKLKNFIQKIFEIKGVKHKFELFFYTEKNQNDIDNLKKTWSSDIEYSKNEYMDYTDVDIQIRGSEFINSRYEEFTSNSFMLRVKKENLKLIDEGNYLIGFVTVEDLLNCIAPMSNIIKERVLAPDVFKNNVRLYLGATTINQNIEKTLREEPSRFHYYNNGLTITTKKIDTSNPLYYEINTVNIVNGGQTANSIYNVFKRVSNEEIVKIPVKIIKAVDDEYEKITIRTNSQNGLSENDLISITRIQKEIEDSFTKEKFQDYSFYYKRQASVTEDNSGDVDFIVTIVDILRATFSTILLMPHKVSGYFDSTTSKYIDIIFEDGYLKLYVIVTALFKIIEQNIEQNNTHRRLKYHITYLFFKFSNKGIDLAEISKYFMKKDNQENATENDIETKNEVVSKIYSNLYQALKDKQIFEEILNYLLNILKNEYPQILDLDTKDKEKILYKTVDISQRGEKIFKDFDDKFKKTIADFQSKKNV